MSESESLQNSADKDAAEELHREQQEQIQEPITPPGGGWITPPPDWAFHTSAGGALSESDNEDTFVRPWMAPEPQQAPEPHQAPEPPTGDQLETAGEPAPVARMSAAVPSGPISHRRPIPRSIKAEVRGLGSAITPPRTAVPRPIGSPAVSRPVEVEPRPAEVVPSPAEVVPSPTAAEPRTAEAEPLTVEAVPRPTEVQPRSAVAEPEAKERDLFRLVMRDIAIPIAVAVAIALFAQAVLAKPYKIPSGSMLPTIQLEDRVLANRFAYRFWPVKRGDVVVFQPPEAAGDTSTPYVKRVIGLSGDTVEIKKGKVLINGQELVIEQAITPTYVKPAEKVPDGMLFVLGDNRNESADSHIWGYLPKDNIIGRADVIYWPIPHIKWLG